MLVDKLRDHLISTPLEELKEEWKSVEKYGLVGPLAIDLINCWDKVFFDISQPAPNLVFKEKNRE